MNEVTLTYLANNAVIITCCTIFLTAIIYQAVSAIKSRRAKA